MRRDLCGRVSAHFPCLGFLVCGMWPDAVLAVYELHILPVGPAAATKIAPNNSNSSAVLVWESGHKRVCWIQCDIPRLDDAVSVWLFAVNHQTAQKRWQVVGWMLCACQLTNYVQRTKGIWFMYTLIYYQPFPVSGFFLFQWSY